ncbi:hypothetical protein AAFF39_00535 [Lactococcus garvieae]
MSKFEVVEADIDENTITLDAGDYFKKGGSIELGEEFILQRAKQHKLTIPKKIADSIVEIAVRNQKFYAENGGAFGMLEASNWLVNFMIAGRESGMNPELFDYLIQDKSGHIETCIAFMNPLTRPFVEVTDE